MESVYLKQLVSNTPQGGVSDVNSPFSFLEWKERLPSIVEKDAVYHYNTYVLEWFAKNKQKTVSQKFILRQRYLYLLDQLQLFFTKEEKNIWYAQVNLADTKELLLAIPYFARKLKDVALYYLKLRKQLKNTKLKYNTVGTTAGLEQEIYGYILETFSTSNKELSSSLYTTLPDFSALQKSLVVKVEELYDDKQYFDLSPTKPLSGYFDLMHQATSEYLETKGIVLSSSEWLFESFNIPVTSNFDSVFSQLTGSLFETSDATLYTDFIQKYIAETKYDVVFTAPLSTTSITDINIAVGNNYFYYPYGTTDTSISIPQQIQIASLSALDVGPATAGTSLDTSDTMLVKNGDVVKSAWLRYQEFEESSKTVKATLTKDSTTSFIYPFPGYGLSGQNVPWTGSGFETKAEYNFLPKDIKAQVNQAYWSQILPADSCDVLLLNNTTLASAGATPSTHPQHADQVYIRLDRSTSTSLPFGELSGAWLYKFTKTAFPISSNQDNVILWPYNVIDTGTYPEYLKNLSFSEVCEPVSIQALSNSFFVAASSFDFADKIYKLNNYADAETDALECAWLSGAMLDSEDYRYINQDGFSSLFSAGDAVRFVWTGQDVELDMVFGSVAHKADCPFATNVPFVSAFEWQKCSCKQVYYSPFGHPYKSFQEGNNFADCITKVTEANLNPLDLGSWRDSTNNPTASSLEFAWYKTKTKHSWGDGQWVSNVTLTAAPFILETGKAYFYKRATSKIVSELMPPYTVNYTFNTNKTKWIDAKMSSDGSWISTENNSVMTIHPGDFIKYGRQAQTISYLLSSYETENTSSNEGSVWSVYDKIPAACGKNNSTTISWPIQSAPFGSVDNQYPSTSFADITAFDAWTITRLEDNETQTITNLNVITFVPPTTGTYSIAVTATKAGGTKVFESTIIPKITAVPPYTDEKIPLEFNTPSSGFLLEHSLKGWDYNNNRYNSYQEGARPFWAVLDTNKDATTRYKGLYSWGYQNGFVDEYIPNDNPILSPIELKFGTILEYFRKGYSIQWNQPIVYKQFVGKKQWCGIFIDTTQSSNLSSFYKIKENSDPIVIATTSPTDIQLSNIINGSPVEVYYNALSNFVWPVSVTMTQEATLPSPSAHFITQAPWNTITNRFYPTIANVPVVEETYSVEDVGGYFLPQNLGASVFLNKDFSAGFKTTQLSGSFVTEDYNIHIGGRGRTKEDQTTIYDWTENNQWLKESSTTGMLAGAVKKSLTKTLQTFIPYQSNIEETSLGLITTRSKLSPWGGLNDEQWMDVANEPKSFTDVRNLSAWAASQVLKQNEKAVDCWTSDIYGNQYGLFKELDGIPVAEHADVLGELWTRTNDQTVDPASVSLSAIFGHYKNNTSLYNQLTGSGIKSIDCYFDTLFIETSSIIIFAKIDYDYNTASIKSVFDDDRSKYLNEGFRFDKNWFFTAEKKVISLFLSAVNIEQTDSFWPVLWELDLPTRKHKQIFPVGSTNQSNLSAGLGALEIKSISKGSIYFNNVLDTFLITYTGTDVNDKMFVVDFYLKYEDQLNLTNIKLYRDLFDTDAINDPPIVLPSYLSAINVGLSSFHVQVSAINEPTSYSLLNYTTSITATLSSGYGSFTGTLSAGLYHVNYTVSNSIGESTYCLTLSAL